MSRISQSLTGVRSQWAPSATKEQTGNSVGQLLSRLVSCRGRYSDAGVPAFRTILFAALYLISRTREQAIETTSGGLDVPRHGRCPGGASRSQRRTRFFV
jgi:hypothetical protein